MCKEGKLIKSNHRSTTLLTILLAVVLTLGCLPVNVHAEDIDPTNTSHNYSGPSGYDQNDPTRGNSDNQNVPDQNVTDGQDDPEQNGSGQAVDDKKKYDYYADEFGISGKDKKKDGTAINDILERIRYSGSVKTIYFPAGKYIVDKPLSVYSNTHIIADKNAIFYRDKTIIDNNLLRGVDKNGKMDKTGGYEMVKNVTIEGGIWDGGDLSKVNESSDLIRFDHATDINIIGCAIKNVYDCHLLEYIGVKNGSIKGCHFSGFKYKRGKKNVAKYAREAVQLESAWTSKPSNLKNKKAHWAKSTKIDGSSCINITVENCTFKNIPCCVGQHHIDKKGKHVNRNIVIRNNKMTLPKKHKGGKHAVSCANTKGLTVENNTIKGPYKLSIYIHSSKSVNILNNRISGCKENSITQISGKTNLISGNTIKGTKKNAISVQKGTVGKITNNNVSKAKSHGFAITGGKVGNLINNKFTNCKMAISSVGGKMGTKKGTGIISNIIKKCRTNGITVSGKGYVNSISKNIIQNTKRNGISLVGGRPVVKYVLNNRIKKVKLHKVWNGLRKKVVEKGNK